MKRLMKTTTALVESGRRRTMDRRTEYEVIGGHKHAVPERYFDTDDVVQALAAYEDTGLSPADIADLRNELCLKCGNYHTAHLGSCDGCRWKKGAHE
jgi:hypothetical protein